MANSLAAIDAGVTWVDATIRGMGRGPGNARTEYLAVELSRRSMVDLDVQPLLDMGAAAVYPPGSVIADTAADLIEKLNLRLGYAQPAPAEKKQ